MKSASPKAIACGDRAGAGQRAEPGDQVLEFLGMARREQHRVAGLDPEAADGAADVARADDADAQLAGCRLRERPRRQRRGQGPAVGGEQRAPGAIES